MTHARIEINPDIMGGNPVIKGARVHVEAILRKLGDVVALDDILTDHPRQTRNDIQASVARMSGSDMRVSRCRCRKPPWVSLTLIRATCSCGSGASNERSV